jgi:hypothetical protein
MHRFARILGVEDVICGFVECPVRAVDRLHEIASRSVRRVMENDFAVLRDLPRHVAVCPDVLRRGCRLSIVGTSLSIDKV